MITRRSSWSGAAILAALWVSASACSDGGSADAAEFCAEVDANKQALTAPKLRTDADVQGYVDLHRRLGELAPLAIEQEWDELTSLYETAATIDPDDPGSIEEAKARSYATEKSAVAVRGWLRSNCSVNLGPVSTIVAHEARTAPPPAPTTIPG